MWIKVSFEAENDAFCEDFEDEIRKVMKQATDFLVEDNYVELKGSHFFENGDETKKMINPYDRTQDDFFEAKHQCMIKYEVTIITNVNKYIKYVRQKYGKNFIKNCIKRKNE